MADFPDNIINDVTTADIENVAKRPYLEENRAPTGLDKGVTGQWWIYIDAETSNVIDVFQYKGNEWVSYLDSKTEIAGLTLDGGITLDQLKKVLSLDEYVKNTLKIAGLTLETNISVEDLLKALDVYPLIVASDPPTKSTKGYEKQMYFDIENSTFYVCRGLIGSGYEWQKAFTGGSGGSVDLSDYVKKDAISTDIDENSTDEQIPSAKLFYDTVGNIETTLESIIAIQENFIGGVTE